MAATESDLAGRDDIVAEIDGLLEELEDLQGPAAAPERRSRKVQGRKEPRRAVRQISVRLASVLIALSIMGTALALTQTTLSTQFLELWQSQTSATDFTLSQFTMLPTGDNQINIDITLDNDDSGSAHFANVTVQLLDSSGDHILNSTQATGSVAASSSVVLNYVFTQSGLVAQYEKAQIVVQQSS